jgi:hypothetical protein
MGPAQPSRSRAYTMGENASPASSSTYWKLLFSMTEPSTKDACVTAMAAWHLQMAAELSGSAARTGPQRRAFIRSGGGGGLPARAYQFMASHSPRQLFNAWDALRTKSLGCRFQPAGRRRRRRGWLRLPALPVPTFSARCLCRGGRPSLQQVDVDLSKARMSRLDGVRAHKVLLHLAPRPSLYHRCYKLMFAASIRATHGARCVPRSAS